VFRLGWFLGSGFGLQAWTPFEGHHPFAGLNARTWMQPDIYIDLTQALERAGFDYILVEDTSMVEDTYGGSLETTLKYGLFAPKNDPLPLIPLLTQASKHIGIIGTISTMQYPPYLAARLLTTLDHLTEGRIGVNVVTSVTNRVAQNFGYDKHLEHGVRYEMADEWMEVVGQLWESWDEDALVVDQDAPRYADHTKVHPINFEGKYFKCRGPLNTIPGPQRRPIVAQAGSSPAGRDLAARHADTMLALGQSVEQMRAFRADMHERLLSYGRKPDDLKILFLVTPVIAATDREAQDKEVLRKALMNSETYIEERLWGLTYISGGEVDFSKFDLDAPMPQIVGNGERSSLAQYVNGNEDKSLREVILSTRHIGDLGLVGSPDTVAAKMGEIMEEVGGDGFLLDPELTRHTISLIADGLAPALRRRGLIRSGYGGSTFRENLFDF
jgi:FMN-dependent oxidoreductase (nitrilotriacetate monooxygenase family)